MNDIEFIQLALKTENMDFNGIRERLSNPTTIRLLHAVMGLVTEGGELMDALKAHIIYGKPLDYVNLIEEKGDSFWYSAVFASALELEGFEPFWRVVIEKLKARYGDAFKEDSAVSRNLPLERITLMLGTIGNYEDLQIVTPWSVSKDPQTIRMYDVSSDMLSSIGVMARIGKNKSYNVGIRFKGGKIYFYESIGPEMATELLGLIHNNQVFGHTAENSVGKWVDAKLKKNMFVTVWRPSEKEKGAWDKIRVAETMPEEVDNGEERDQGEDTAV